MSPMPKPANQTNRSLLVALGSLAAILVVVAGALLYVLSRSHDKGSTVAAPIGGPFSLTDQNGQPVTDQTYAGHFRLIYFGYTFCPDACPTELQVMAQAVDLLGSDAAKVQPIFITVDPARDTSKQLAGYVPLFDKRLVGLTGTPQQIAQVAREYKVYYAKADAANGDPNAYAMNHSSFVYLMAPDGKFLTVFSSDTDADKMAQEIKRYMRGVA